jgi:peptidoglycan/LPS O-acetylase OafA/YrhL
MGSQNRGQIYAAILLIGLGVFFLASNFISGYFLQRAWPGIFYAIAAAFYLPSFLWGPERRRLAGLLIPGSIMLSLGLIFTYNVLTGDWLSWAYGWSLIVAGVGLGLALGGRVGEWGRPPTWVGIWMLVSSVAVFSVFGALFGGPWLKSYAPMLLVVCGLALILAGFKKPVEKP